MGFYDQVNMEIKTVHERCRDYYQPEDFVIVENIDAEPLTYTIQRPENVSIHQPSPVEKELYYTKDPDTVTLKPGQSRLVPAYEADWMIKCLIDKLVLRRRAQAQSRGETPAESAMDPTTQHRYIRLIFKGKRDFVNEYNGQRETADEKSKEAIERALTDESELPSAKPTAKQAA